VFFILGVVVKKVVGFGGGGGLTNAHKIVDVKPEIKFSRNISTY